MGAEEASNDFLAGQAGGQAAAFFVTPGRFC